MRPVGKHDYCVDVSFTSLMLLIGRTTSSCKWSAACVVIIVVSEVWSLLLLLKLIEQYQ